MAANATTMQCITVRQKIAIALVVGCLFCLTSAERAHGFVETDIAPSSAAHGHCASPPDPLRPIFAADVLFAAPGDIYELQAADRWRRRALSAFCIAYFFILGAVVGSFLNVVVYRLPAGINLLWPGSRCPRCNTPIRLLDNIPIVSWWRLGGRCRACASAIPPRYMFVELGTGLVFLALGLGELLSGGANLPGRAVNSHVGVYWILWETKWDLVGIYLFHLGMACVLISAGLIVWDGKLLPGRLVGFGLALGLLLPLFFPGLRPLPWRVDLEPGWAAWRGLVDGLLGYAAGIIGGLLLNHAAIHPRETLRRGLGGVDILAISGACLGWQAAVGVAAWSAWGLLVDNLLSAANPQRRRWPVGAMAALAVIPQLALWRRQQAWLSRLDGGSGQAMVAVLLASFFILMAVTWLLPQPIESSHAYAAEGDAGSENGGPAVVTTLPDGPTENSE